MSYEVELCLDSLDACIGAQQVGANRVELCTRLDIDGLTPDPALVSKVRDAISIDLHVLVRPSGGSFVYTESQLDKMQRNIETFKQIGVDGIVSGALLTDGSLDKKSTEHLIKATGKSSFTFHRAFDVCQNPALVYHELQDYGVNRLLTSGQGRTALEGIAVIESLAKQNPGPRIMVGGGVNFRNVEAFWQIGIRSFHFSCQEKESRIFDSNKAVRTMNRLRELAANG